VPLDGYGAHSLRTMGNPQIARILAVRAALDAALHLLAADRQACAREAEGAHAADAAMSWAPALGVELDLHAAFSGCASAKAACSFFSVEKPGFGIFWRTN
jgi:hypothetical protein